MKTTQEQNPFETKAWKNKWSRLAILCLLALLPIGILWEIFQIWWLSAAGMVLCGITLVLTIIAACTAKPEDDGVSEEEEVL